MADKKTNSKTINPQEKANQGHCDGHVSDPPKSSHNPMVKTSMRILEGGCEEGPREEGKASGFLKLKVTAHDIKALVQEKKETRLKEQEELLNKVDKVTLSVDKGKPKRTQSEEICEEFKELEELSPLEDEVVKPSKKKRNDLKDALKRIAWSDTKWDRTPTEKYQLFRHNLNIKFSVWLLFVKKKIMPTHYDSTISMDKVILHYCIMEEIPVNMDKIIYRGEGWTVYNTRPHPVINLRRNKAKDKCFKIKKEGKVEVNKVEFEEEEGRKSETHTPLRRKKKGEEEASSSPHQVQIITIPSSLRQEENPQTLVVDFLDPTTIPIPNLNDSPVDQGDDAFQDMFEDSLYDPLTLIHKVFKDPVDVALSPVGSLNKEVLEKAVDDPLLKGKQISSKEVGEARPLSLPKQTSK
ncbi:protein MNN4-like [Cucumis melo var. makuwa]|uniref:Protein MNN4-like n=1 Tax=Cucumis melo var. makuwa TaxID=1194695 RepID=A0A5D3BSJ3_CUCMM|nr:protein MNN4-like [Cucumis melo var. makuwa]TYK02124.1 protein MNN4-like [Cucumis melo var. makuwa]